MTRRNNLKYALTLKMLPGTLNIHHVHVIIHKEDLSIVGKTLTLDSTINKRTEPHTGGTYEQIPFPNITSRTILLQTIAEYR